MERAEVVHDAFLAGRQAWPQVALDERKFSAWVETAAVGDTELVAFGSDLYLAAACVVREPAALATFDREFVQRLGIGAVGRVALEEHEADELRQQVRVRLLIGDEPRIAGYRGHGPLQAWVRVAAARLAFELKRAPQRKSDDTSMLERLANADVDPELAAAKAQHRDLFAGALEEGFANLTSREKTLLRMYFLDGMNIDQISLVFRVHRATVARWLVRIRKQMLDHLCSRMAVDLRGTASEVNSLVHLVRSDIELSVRRLLAGSQEVVPIDRDGSKSGR
jgi:RNA polymerase sigma-70 factor, ECF subfamily